MSEYLMRRLISTDEYHLMGECGILSEDERVELLNGEIIHMSPIGRRHLANVNKIAEILIFKLERKANLSIQNPILIADHSEPEPDIVLLKRREDHYAARKPKAEDVILLIEVADSSLDKDREIKLPIYAEAEIPEVWIINLEKDEIEVYRQPIDDTYKIREIMRGSEILEIEALNISLKAEQILA